MEVQVSALLLLRLACGARLGPLAVAWLSNTLVPSFYFKTHLRKSVMFSHSPPRLVKIKPVGGGASVLSTGGRPDPDLERSVSPRRTPRGMQAMTPAVQAGPEEG